MREWSASSWSCTRRKAFSLAELLVVIGIVSLLLAILLPPLQHARRKAMQTRCAANLQEHARALEMARNEFDGFYPLWDDDTGPARFTWIDVLIQRRLLDSVRSGYCPQDAGPDPLNEARGQTLGLIYPRDPSRAGIDYSYGIGVPLAAGGWAWRPGYGRPDDPFVRRFDRALKESNVSGRLLAADGNWSAIYNLSGAGLSSGIWNDPSWYDNTVGYRHPSNTANVAYQDGHVSAVRYNLASAEPVDTGKTFVWYRHEPLRVGPDSTYGPNHYPDTPPPSFQSSPRGTDYPSDLLPYYYTAQQSWTLIEHKNPGPADDRPQP
jgi:prepilin-type processing-associated H-X9-DG protein/prepilin-type N-terminal cleavage/methylation domain-containing protein